MCVECVVFLTTILLFLVLGCIIIIIQLYSYSYMILLPEAVVSCPANIKVSTSSLISVSVNLLPFSS